MSVPVPIQSPSSNAVKYSCCPMSPLSGPPEVLTVSVDGKSECVKFCPTNSTSDSSFEDRQASVLRNTRNSCIRCLAWRWDLSSAFCRCFHVRDILCRLLAFTSPEMCGPRGPRTRAGVRSPGLWCDKAAPTITRQYHGSFIDGGPFAFRGSNSAVRRSTAGTGPVGGELPCGRHR